MSASPDTRQTSGLGRLAEQLAAGRHGDTDGNTRWENGQDWGRKAKEIIIGLRDLRGEEKKKTQTVKIKGNPVAGQRQDEGSCTIYRT